jgi:RNA polymerase sigma-70 factor (ECF subfamily)
VSSQSGLTDAALLQAVDRGDEEAFIELYRRHGERVHRFAYRMTGSADTARDITQACFTSLLKAPRRYDGRVALSTYLCAAARNQSLRHASRAWRERTTGTMPEQRPSPARGPLELLLEDERARIVRAALDRLGPLHREVLILAEYEEMSLGEIARVVGASVGAVKVRLHRARGRLRNVLETHRRSGALAVGTRR